MQLVQFVKDVISSELCCVEFLRTIGLISTMMICSCGNNMALRVRKQKSGNQGVFWRYSRKNCRREISVRSECSFFAFNRADGMLRS